VLYNLWDCISLSSKLPPPPPPYSKRSDVPNSHRHNRQHPICTLQFFHMYSVYSPMHKFRSTHICSHLKINGAIETSFGVQAPYCPWSTLPCQNLLVPAWTPENLTLCWEYHLNLGVRASVAPSCSLCLQPKHKHRPPDSVHHTSIWLPPSQSFAFSPAAPHNFAQILGVHPLQHMNPLPRRSPPAHAGFQSACVRPGGGRGLDNATFAKMSFKMVGHGES